MVSTSYPNSYGRRDPIPECMELPQEIDEQPVQPVVKGSGLRRVECPCCESVGEHIFGAGEDADGIICGVCQGWGSLEVKGDRPPIIRRHPVRNDLRLASLDLSSPVAADIWAHAQNAAKHHRSGLPAMAGERRQDVGRLVEGLEQEDIEALSRMMIAEPKAEYQRGEGILMLMATKVINHAAQRILERRANPFPEVTNSPAYPA